MKTLLCKLVPGLLLVSLLGGSASAQGRIATIDLRRVYENYWKTKQVFAGLEDRAADLKKDRKPMIDDLKRANDEYQASLTEANNQTLSLEEREKRKKSAEDKLRQIKDMEEAITQYDRQANASVVEQGKRMRDKILEEIRMAVSGKAKSAGYALVIDPGAESGNGNAAAGTPGTPVFLYANNENDITDAVLAQLNAGAPAETPKTQEKTTEKKGEKKKDNK